MQRVPGVSQG